MMAEFGFSFGRKTAEKKEAQLRLTDEKLKECATNNFTIESLDSNPSQKVMKKQKTKKTHNNNQNMSRSFTNSKSVESSKNFEEPSKKQ